MGDQGSFLQLACAEFLGKPKAYSGRRTDWFQWKYASKAYAGTLDGDLPESLEQTERLISPVPVSGLNEVRRGQIITLALIISQVLQGSSLQLVMNVPGCRGQGAWRRLARLEEPATGAAQVPQLMCVLNAKVDGGPTKFAEQFQILESRFQAREKQHNERLSGRLKQAALKQNAPANIKAQVDMQTFVL
ncbi:unnamed protein product, partial [Prorocentrum cordatum]